MIKINLLPAEFRTQAAVSSLFIHRRKIAAGGGAFFIVLTLVFYVQYQWAQHTLGGVESHWLSLQKDVQRVTELQLRIEGGSKREKEFLEQYVKSPFSVTAMLNAVNRFLPDSVWLIELKVTRQPKGSTFLIKGLSLPSSRKSSIQDIEQYLREMKAVFPPRTEVVLTTSRQIRENRELTLFTAIFKWS